VNKWIESPNLFKANVPFWSFTLMNTKNSRVVVQHHIYQKNTQYRLCTIFIPHSHSPSIYEILMYITRILKTLGQLDVFYHFDLFVPS